MAQWSQNLPFGLKRLWLACLLPWLSEFSLFDVSCMLMCCSRSLIHQAQLEASFLVLRPTSLKTNMYKERPQLLLFGTGTWRDRPTA